MAFNTRMDFFDLVRQYAQGSLNQAAKEIIEKETEDFRRRIAKKVYKDIDSMTVHFMERLSPKTLTTHLHIGFTEKNNETK